MTVLCDGSRMLASIHCVVCIDHRCKNVFTFFIHVAFFTFFNVFFIFPTFSKIKNVENLT